MIQRHDLTDEQWERLHRLLPKAQRGPQPRELRRDVNGILWILRTGAPWRDLPPCYGAWQTVASRFYRWRKAEVWDAVLAELQRRGDAAGQLDWSAHFVDGTVIRAHQHAAGARRGKGGGSSKPTPKRSDAARAASRPNCTCAPSGAASPSPSC